MQVSTAEFKKGLRIVFDGQPYAIVDFQHVKPGKGGAFVRTKLKHMKLGKVIDNTFRSGEKVELVDFEEKHMQFLYRDDRYNFMDTETYEQLSLSSDQVGDARDRRRRPGAAVPERGRRRQGGHANRRIPRSRRGGGLMAVARRRSGPRDGGAVELARRLG